MGNNENKTRLSGSDLIKVIGFCISIIILVYQCYVEAPSFKYYQKDNVAYYTANGSFKNIHLTLHPQIVIYYGDTIYYVAYLKNYFSEEDFYFDVQDNKPKVEAKFRYSDSAEKLRSTLESDINQCLDYELQLKKSNANNRLRVEISILAGVTYQNSESDAKKQICFIQTDGQIKRYNPSSQLIKGRLKEDEIFLTENKNSPKLQKKVQEVVNEISLNIYEESG